jgi:hypothetical protein
VTFDDVTIVVRREFAEEQFGVVMTVLNEYGIETWEREKVRVQLAALKLANGDLKALKRHITLASRTTETCWLPLNIPNIPQQECFTFGNCQPKNKDKSLIAIGNNMKRG